MTEETNAPTAGADAGAPALDIADTNPPVSDEAQAEQVEADQEGEGEEEEQEQPRKKSGSARLRERLDREIAEKAALAERLRILTEQQTPVATQEEREPREEDFNGDFFAWQRALATYEARQSVRAELEAIKGQTARERAALEAKRNIETYNERVSSFRSQVPDYDEVMADAEGVPVSDAMVEIIRASERGPALAYRLAKNPAEAARIAQMPPLLAARELGRIEASITPAKPKTDSKAPAPIKPVGGGFKATKSPGDMSVEEMASYLRQRKVI